MRKPLFYATITKTFEHKKGGKDVYLSSEYLKQFDKDLYYKILLLESFEDQAWHTAAQLAQVVQLDARSVSKYLNELSKNYQQFSGKTHPLFTKNHRSGYNFYDTLDSIEHERFLIYLVQSTLKFQLLHDIFFEEFHTMYQLRKSITLVNLLLIEKSMNGNSNCKLTEFGCNEVHISLKAKKKSFDFTCI